MLQRLANTSLSSVPSAPIRPLQTHADDLAGKLRAQQGFCSESSAGQTARPDKHPAAFPDVHALRNSTSRAVLGMIELQQEIASCKDACFNSGTEMDCLDPLCHAAGTPTIAFDGQEPERGLETLSNIAKACGCPSVAAVAAVEEQLLAPLYLALPQQTPNSLDAVDLSACVATLDLLPTLLRTAASGHTRAVLTSWLRDDSAQLLLVITPVRILCQIRWNVAVLVQMVDLFPELVSLLPDPIRSEHSTMLTQHMYSQLHALLSSADSDPVVLVRALLRHIEHSPDATFIDAMRKALEACKARNLLESSVLMLEMTILQAPRIARTLLSVYRCLSALDTHPQRGSKTSDTLSSKPHAAATKVEWQDLVVLLSLSRSPLVQDRGHELLFGLLFGEAAFESDDKPAALMELIRMANLESWAGLLFEFVTYAAEAATRVKYATDGIYRHLTLCSVQLFESRPPCRKELLEFVSRSIVHETNTKLHQCALDVLAIISENMPALFLDHQSALENMLSQLPQLTEQDGDAILFCLQPLSQQSERLKTSMRVFLRKALFSPNQGYKPQPPHIRRLGLRHLMILARTNRIPSEQDVDEITAMLASAFASFAPDLRAEFYRGLQQLALWIPTIHASSDKRASLTCIIIDNTLPLLLSKLRPMVTSPKSASKMGRVVVNPNTSLCIGPQHELLVVESGLADLVAAAVSISGLAAEYEGVRSQRALQELQTIVNALQHYAEFVGDIALDSIHCVYIPQRLTVRFQGPAHKKTAIGSQLPVQIRLQTDSRPPWLDLLPLCAQYIWVRIFIAVISTKSKSEEGLTSTNTEAGESSVWPTKALLTCALLHDAISHNKSVTKAFSATKIPLHHHSLALVANLALNLACHLQSHALMPMPASQKRRAAFEMLLLVQLALDLLAECGDGLRSLFERKSEAISFTNHKHTIKPAPASTIPTHCMSTMTVAFWALVKESVQWSSPAQLNVFQEGAQLYAKQFTPLVGSTWGLDEWTSSTRVYKIQLQMVWLVERLSKVQIPSQVSFVASSGQSSTIHLHEIHQSTNQSLLFVDAIHGWIQNGLPANVLVAALELLDWMLQRETSASACSDLRARLHIFIDVTKDYNITTPFVLRPLYTLLLRQLPSQDKKVFRRHLWEHASSLLAMSTNQHTVKYVHASHETDAARNANEPATKSGIVVIWKSLLDDLLQQLTTLQTLDIEASHVFPRLCNLVQAKDCIPISLHNMLARLALVICQAFVHLQRLDESLSSLLSFLDGATSFIIQFLAWALADQSPFSNPRFVPKLLAKWAHAQISLDSLLSQRRGSRSLPEQDKALAESIICRLHVHSSSATDLRESPNLAHGPSSDGRRKESKRTAGSLDQEGKGNEQSGQEKIHDSENEALSIPRLERKLKGKRQRLRSRNPFIDVALRDEDGLDSYADLEEFIVCRKGRSYE
eukprot:TRINITY_DN5839_c0_g1_i1.p1 TRINITY_DN5839_c0_g1~~TRINITY_DN5839_c0_g1_i1.p1  ORF type:complete len:1436 (+),score=289.03 TRINITY_DN5839_c0_g1_i1:65-4372(+)